MSEIYKKYIEEDNIKLDTNNKDYYSWKNMLKELKYNLISLF